MQFANCMLSSINTIWFIPPGLGTWAPQTQWREEVYFTAAFFQVAEYKQA